MITTALSEPAACSDDVNILSLMPERLTRWKSGDRGWASALENKIVGWAFARSLGVATPRILHCASRPADLPPAWPSQWGARFVVKPLHGSSALGVLLLDGGVDRLSNRTVRGRDDVLALYRKHRKAGWTRQPVLVEEMVQRPGGEPALDVKFYMLGGKFGGAYIDLGPADRHGASHKRRKDVNARACVAWVDADGQTRTDRHGCVIQREGKGCGRPLCQPEGVISAFSLCRPPCPARTT